MPIPELYADQCRRVLIALRQLGSREDIIAENLWLTSHRGVPGYTHAEPARAFVQDRMGVDIVILAPAREVRVYVGGLCVAELTSADGVPEALFEYARKFHAGGYMQLIAKEIDQAAVRADRCG